MFQSLTDKLAEAFKKFRNKGKLTEADVKAGMREIKLALLEADVNFKVVRDFIKTVTERAVGAEVLESLMPAQQTKAQKPCKLFAVTFCIFVYMYFSSLYSRQG